MSASSTTPASPRTVSRGEALAFWLKLGFISFGGPAGQISIMHTELVERRRWISEQRFLHALNYCMVLPGPEAQQLATYLGWLMHGTWGGIAAGALFVLPSLVILSVLSWIYLALGHVWFVAGAFDGMKPAVVAVVAFAVLRIGSKAIKSVAAFVLAAGAFVALLFHVPFPVILLVAGLSGLLMGRIWPQSIAGGGHASKKLAVADEPGALPVLIGDEDEALAHTRPSAARFVLHLAVGLVLWAVPTFFLWQWQGSDGVYPHMALFFTQSALLTFGGAYAVLPYVSDHAIAAGWLERGQVTDGLALGETTPGPLIMFVAFVGFVGGANQLGTWPAAWMGAVVATYFTFLPSFLFILLGAPFIERMRGELKLSSVLGGITAAVVGVILHLAFTLGRDVFLGPTHNELHLLSIAIAASAFVLLWRFKVDIVALVLGCGSLGILARAFTG